ncbi:hypothetical protein GCM10010276_88620 [Streptomyces longisporus]|uniref:Uncharacterized protein n=1 Tax=Streptomyces longisporus TaxID=1948 RepID=A0ABN3NJ18_STRLO
MADAVRRLLDALPNAAGSPDLHLTDAPSPTHSPTATSSPSSWPQALDGRALFTDRRGPQTKLQRIHGWAEFDGSGNDISAIARLADTFVYLLGPSGPPRRGAIAPAGPRRVRHGHTPPGNPPETTASEQPAHAPAASEFPELGGPFPVMPDFKACTAAVFEGHGRKAT